MATESQLREVVGILLSRIRVKGDCFWSRIPTKQVQALIKKPDLFVVSFLDFMGQLIVDEPFSVDRSTPFNPAKFIGSGWSTWKGPIDGNGLDGEEQQDARSLAITELDLSKLLFEHCLKEKERTITGEEKLARLKADEARFILPDARIAQALFEEPGHRTLEWIRVNLGKTWFDFPGTELRSPDGNRCILDLYLSGSVWDWDYDCLVDDWRANNPSCVLASNKPLDT